MRSAFEEKQIGELAGDVAVLEHISTDCAGLLERNTEGGRGSCLLDGIAVLIDAALDEYQAELAKWRKERPATETNEVGQGPI